MNKIVALIFLGILVAVQVSKTTPTEHAQATTAVVEAPKAKRLQPHEPHAGDDEDMASVRADYAAHCTGSEPIGYTKQMCDQLLYGINKVDFGHAALGLVCTIGGSQSYACRDESERRQKQR